MVVEYEKEVGLKKMKPAGIAKGRDEFGVGIVMARGVDKLGPSEK